MNPVYIGINSGEYTKVLTVDAILYEAVTYNALKVQIQINIYPTYSIFYTYFLSTHYGLSCSSSFFHKPEYNTAIFRHGYDRKQVLRRCHPCKPQRLIIG